MDKIAFTGSTAAGKRIAAIAGESLKRVSLELGGKSATIVLPDADLEKVAAGLKFTSFLNNGQACMAHTRVLVHESQHDKLVELMVAMLRSIKVGDPEDPETFLGPLVSERQQQRVLDYIKSGIEEGATLAFGGLGMPEGLTQGAFVRPTLFSHVRNDMRIAQEEIFGPVVCVIPYKDVDEAITIANDSQYGLSGGVWTENEAAALDVARKIRTGTIGINGRWPDFSAPFGGYKNSGIGREFGSVGISMYLEHKAIYL